MESVLFRAYRKYTSKCLHNHLLLQGVVFVSKGFPNHQGYSVVSFMNNQQTISP